jgi:cobalt/nickel transport system permease protein
MSDIGARIKALRTLEGLSAGNTAIHRLHPLAKLMCTFVFIVMVASVGRYGFTQLAPYLFYPFVISALAELPHRILLPRVLIALPFCLFAGLSNVFFDRGTALVLGGVAVSYGVISLATILLKMYLCVMAALLLVAAAPMTEITSQLRRLRVPLIFVMVLDITYRYIGVLFEEALTGMTAYRLRSGGKKALAMKHMGTFAGQLLLRGFDRAERVHVAMRCRGYSLRHIPPARQPWQYQDTLAVLMVCVPAAALRFV